MGALEILVRTQDGGLDVRVVGDKLRVTGPTRLRPIAMQLLDRKAEVIGLLRAEAPEPLLMPSDLPADWRIEWEERAAIREYDGGQAREHAEAEALREIVERMRIAGLKIKMTGYPC